MLLIFKMKFYFLIFPEFCRSNSVDLDNKPLDSNSNYFFNKLNYSKNIKFNFIKLHYVYSFFYKYFYSY